MKSADLFELKRTFRPSPSIWNKDQAWRLANKKQQIKDLFALHRDEPDVIDDQLDRILR